MPYPNIAIPTYAELEPQVVAWAAARGLVDDEGKPLKATPTSQHGKTMEEIGEATKALTYWEPCRRWTEDQPPKYIEVTRRELALEFGDILVTLVIQAAMHGSTLEQCMVESGRLGTGFGSDWGLGKVSNPPRNWEHVVDWAEMLRMALNSAERFKSSYSKRVAAASARQYIGAIARCVEEECRIQLSLLGPECLALALGKIAGRSGEVVDGVFVKAVEQCSL